MRILGRGVVEVLGADDESRKKYAVTSTRDSCKEMRTLGMGRDEKQGKRDRTLGQSRDFVAEALEVNESGKEGGNLNVGRPDKLAYKVFKGGE